MIMSSAIVLQMYSSSHEASCENCPESLTKPLMAALSDISNDLLLLLPVSPLFSDDLIG